MLAPFIAQAASYYAVSVEAIETALQAEKILHPVVDTKVVNAVWQRFTEKTGWEVIPVCGSPASSKPSASRWILRVAQAMNPMRSAQAQEAEAPCFPRLGLHSGSKLPPGSIALLRANSSADLKNLLMTRAQGEAHVQLIPTWIRGMTGKGAPGAAKAGPISTSLSPPTYTLPSCAQQAAVIYNVPLAAVMTRLQQSQGVDPFNPMGLAPAADPVLAKAGFDLRLVHDNACWNEAAGIWLMARMGIRGPGHALVSAAHATPNQIKVMVQKAAILNHIPAALIQAVMDQESRFHAGAVSTSDALGLMQLIPSTARRYGVTNPFDPWQNINAGAAYLADLLRQFDGSIPLALAAYNAGPGAVMQAHGIPHNAETQKYVPSVISKYTLYTWRAQQPNGQTPLENVARTP